MSAESDVAEMMRQDAEQEATFARNSAGYEAFVQAQAAQILRLAERAPAVSIYLLNKACDVWFWFCAKHRDARVADEWTVREIRQVKHPLTCDDCKREERQ